MLNSYGVPVEQNDRLLELAYVGTPQGCRHDFPYKYRDEPCTKCRAKWWAWNQFPSDPDRNPAVGDGHAMDLGEMVRLAQKLGIYEIDLYALAPGEWCCELFNNPKRFEDKTCLAAENGDTPEAALAAAIIAAVDGAK